MTTSRYTRIPLEEGGGREETVWHLGHSVRLGIFRVGWTQYRWRYRIDDGPVKVCEDRPLRKASVARDEALMEARWAIDRMPR